MNKEIKEEWFKDHIAKYTVINDKLKILEWRKPDSMHMGVRYVMDGNNLYITGDLYSAMFRLTQQANLESLGKYDLYYFSQKMVMMERDETEFRPAKAIEELKEALNENYEIDVANGFEEYEESYEDAFDMIVCGIRECSDRKSWEEFLNMNYYRIDEVFPNCSEWIFEIGLVTSPYLKAYLIGLQMAHEQLFRNNNHE